jgi:hypothetical protein
LVPDQPVGVLGAAGTQQHTVSSQNDHADSTFLSFTGYRITLIAEHPTYGGSPVSPDRPFAREAAYGHRCYATGESSLEVLDAAHIQT